MSSIPVETVTGLVLLGVFALATRPLHRLFHAPPGWARNTARGDILLFGYALILLAALVLLVHGLV